MQNILYEEKEFEAMRLMGQEGTFWGMQTSPMACAYENNMLDVIGHPCIQRQLSRMWYNRNPDSIDDTNSDSDDSDSKISESPNGENSHENPSDKYKTAAASKLTDWCKVLHAKKKRFCL